RFAPALLFAFALAPTVAASAAEIAGRDGRITLIYDDAIWTARHDPEGQPELVCAGPSCGGDTAACGTSMIDGAASPLNQPAGLDAYRAALDRRTLANARATAGVASNPRIVTPAAISTIDGRTAVSLTMRIDLEEQATRVDYFWLPSGADLVGLACLVAESAYER